ncbi:immunoglobulin-binding protein 1 [Papilio machaon]|uniref:immunoglobulin-binding protein 1 n=1 Tax=Papilio machaon TaxID=76193 RepID=UPI001E6659A8|nr:immunoglobulin-binding protein 1 [Papilio machaon]
MAEVSTPQSSNDESLKEMFDSAMKMFNDIENGKEATNSDPVQMTIKSAIGKFEKTTNRVSLLEMFSKNESFEELPTDSLQYLLLPALLGTLTLKLCGRHRKDIIDVAEVYFKDFLTRCRDYGLTDVMVSSSENETQTITTRPQSEIAKITNMVQSREAKIKRYKEAKELKDKLTNLSKAMSLAGVDEETKREYAKTMLLHYINQAVDELASIEQEKPILEYMAKHSGEPKSRQKERSVPLKPVIITRDAIQKAVFGAGYPSLPTMTVEEFYDKRVKEGTFPGPNIPHTKIQSADTDQDEAEQIHKERLIEEDDPEELERQRNMDEYKDDHRRGWGNRHNRS